jgi:retron-type reverse transcriptase
VQVITPAAEPYFSDNSYGSRPGRKAEQAIIKLLKHLNDRYGNIVDIDLGKSFDYVPRDKLMKVAGRTIKDPDTE